MLDEADFTNHGFLPSRDLKDIFLQEAKSKSKMLLLFLDLTVLTELKPAHKRF